MTSVLIREWLDSSEVQTKFIEPGSPWENGYAEMTSDHRICPNCRATVPADAPEGVCPACALRAGFEPEYERLGDFELLREIGRGGMGVVYEARQISLKRRVALKVLPPGLGLTDQAVQRFEREAQAAASLHHTNIVPVYATGEDQGCHYYAMELVEGQSLSQVLDDLRGEKSSPLMEATVTQVVAGTSDAPAFEPTGAADSATPSDTDTGGRKWFKTVAKLLADAGDALHYAHERGVIHRDVKPANLLLSGDGRLCLGDFGIARLAQEPGMTVSGSFIGTPAYMSPEQVAAGRVKLDHRTDVYSLGAVLYEMLTLQRPFEGDSREQILTGILSKDPKPPRRLKPRIPIDLETICLKAMEKDPDRRYATAEEMAADLRQFLQRGLIAARRAGPLRRAGKFVRRHPLATVTAAALLVVAGLAWWVWIASARQSHEAALRAFADARYYLSQGEYESGLERVEAALASSPDLAEARLLRARLLMKLRRYDAAVTEARGMVEADPGDWTGHLILALAANAPESAFRVMMIPGGEHLAEVERLAPDTADAYHLRAVAADDATEAIALLDRALAIDPAHAEALYERSRRHAERKDFEAALRDADRLVAVRPRSAQGHRMAGRLYVDQHDTDSAMEQFAEALRIDPDDPITLNERSRLYRALGRREDAFADIDRAIELDPDYARSYYERAQLQASLERVDHAVEDARRALELKPGYADAEVLLFETLLILGRREELAGQMKRWEEELAADQELTFEPEESANLHLARAWLQIAQQQPQAALGHADRAVEAAPDWWSVYIQRANIRWRAGDVGGAEQDCARAASIDLSSPEDLVERGLSLTLDPCDSPDLGRADFSRAVDAAPWWADPYLRRAEALQEEKRFDEALADADRAIERAPAWGEAYHLRGRLHNQRERFEQALADLDRAAELGLGSADSVGRISLLLLEDRVDARLGLGREEEALALLDAALLDRPDWTGARMHKIKSLIWLGRREGALEAADAGIAASEEGSDLPIFVAALYGFRALLRAVESRDCDQAGADLQVAERMLEGTFWKPYLHAFVARIHVSAFREFCPTLYDGPLSLERARAGLALDPDDEEAQRSLGYVLYREGKFTEALEVLERLDEEHEFDEAEHLFYLAMTNWKLGRRAEARRCNDRAVSRLEATFPNQRGWRRLQREAAALLGVGQ
jgi:serine/threonine protein kinase/Tfp pilus assembly protein PilF